MRTHSFRARGNVWGVAPRLLLVALVAIGVVTLNPFALWQGIAVVAAVMAAVVPRTMTAWVAAACLPLGILVTEPSATRTALAVLLVHAIHVLGALSLVIPLTSRLAIGVLAPSLRRFLGVQLIAQPLVLGVSLLTREQTVGEIGWLAPVAAGVLLIGVAVALRALKRVDRAPLVAN